MSRYGRTLDPDRSLQSAHGAKVIRQKVVIVNNPSTIGQNEELRVNFPNLGPNDVIVPGTARLAFDIAISSTDATRTLVQNIGRAIVNKITVKISGNQVLSVDDADIIGCFQDMWKSKGERKSLVYQGIDTSANTNVTRLRIGASNKAADVAADAAVKTAYGSRFYVPLDFELLERHMPYHQHGLGEHLEYALTFNSYKRVIKLKSDATDVNKGDAKYEITNISLEFDKITDSQLADSIRGIYMGKKAFLYTDVMRVYKKSVNKSDTILSFSLNNTARSLRGILLLFEDQTDWTRDTESFYNPKITKVEVTIDGQTSQIYAQGLTPHYHWEEMNKFLGGGTKRHPATGAVCKDLQLADVNVGEYLTTKYGLWIDFRGVADNSLHGTGRPIMNANNGITLQITNTAETAGVLNSYLYTLRDAQVNFEGRRFINSLM